MPRQMRVANPPCVSCPSAAFGSSKPLEFERSLLEVTEGKSIDAEGHPSPTHIYIRLPRGRPLSILHRSCCGTGRCSAPVGQYCPAVHEGRLSQSLAADMPVAGIWPSWVGLAREERIGSRRRRCHRVGHLRIERIPAHGRGDSGLGSQRKRVVSVSRLGCVPQGETDAQPDHFWMTWRAQDTVRSTPRELSAHTSSPRTSSKANRKG